MSEDEGNNWVNSTNPPPLVMELMLLEKKQGFFESCMALIKYGAKGSTVDGTRSLSWLFALWCECSGVLQRENITLFNKIQEAVKTKDVNIHIDSFHNLMAGLDKKGMRWDTVGGVNIGDIQKKEGDDFDDE